MERKGKAEKAIENAMSSFIKYRQEAEERFFTFEEEQLKRENELRREEREHELRLFQMLGQMMRPPEQEHYTQHYPTVTITLKLNLLSCINCCSIILCIILCIILLSTD